MATAGIKFYAYLNFAWTDITSDVQVAPSPNALWGLGSNSPTVKVAKTGVLNFDLDNVSKQYNPDGSSPLSGWGKGTPIKVVFTYLGFQRVRFYGVVEKISIDAGLHLQRKAHVTVLDWLDYAAKYPIEIPVIEEDKTADYAIQQLIDAMPIAPQVVSFDEGITEFPTIFDSASAKTNAYAEFVKYINSEGGLLYLEKDSIYGETLVLKNFTSRSGNTPVSTVLTDNSSGFLLKVDGDYLLKTDDGKIKLTSFTSDDVVIDNEFSNVDTSYGNNIINYFTVSANPKRVTTNTSLIYSLENHLPIGSGQTKTFRIQYTDPSSKRRLAALPPDDDGTIVLLKGEGSQNSDVITDETERVWTSSGVETVSSPKKFGISSLFFDGSSSYIYSADSPDFDFGTRDFTVEFWLYHTGGAAGQTICRRNMTSAFPAFALGRSDGTNMLIDMSSDGVSNDIANGKSWGTMTFDTWVHYALCRDGSNFYAFKNGVLTDSWTSSGSLFAESGVLSLGRNNATYFEGNIDEFRIILDDAKYTAGFTPPTTEFFISGVFYEAVTAADVDIKDQVSLSIDYGGVGADVTVTNNYSQTAYLSVLDIYSYIVQSDVPIVNIQEDSGSIAEFGYQTIDVQMPYQQDINVGAIDGARIIEREKDPRLTIQKVTMVANRSDFMMSCFLNIDVGDLVRLKESQTEVDSLYWVNGVEWRVIGSNVIEFSWIVKDFNSLLLGLSPLAIEFDASSTDAITFGYLPYMDEALRGNFTIATWVYIDGSTGTYQIIGANSSTSGSVNIGLHDADNRNLYFSDSMFDTNSGSWRTTTLAVTYGSWHHLAVTYNSLAASDPIVYIDGTSQTITEIATPSGTSTVSTYPITVLGNIKTSGLDYIFPTDGKIKDYRTYNRILTSAEITTLYNSGTPDVDLVTDGLIFQAACVRTGELANYEDIVLTSDLKVIDNIYGVIGTPNGTPTGREF